LQEALEPELEAWHSSEQVRLIFVARSSFDYLGVPREANVCSELRADCGSADD